MTRMLPILMLVSGCAHNWDRQDTMLFAAYATAATADAYTTTKIQYDDNLTEQNPVARLILGDNPSTASTWQTAAILLTCNYLIARAMPETWRKRYLITWTAGHSIATINNCNHGLC